MKIKRLQSGDEILLETAIKSTKCRDEKANVTPEHLIQLCSDPNTFVITAFDDEKPVGFLIAYLLPRLANNHPMMLFYEIEVMERYRKQGTGTAMIDLLKDYCKTHNVCKMWVLTNESNKAAMKLYQSTGGVLMEEDDMVIFEYMEELELLR